MYINNAIHLLARTIINNLYVVKEGEHISIKEFWDSQEVQNVIDEITKE